MPHSIRVRVLREMPGYHVGQEVNVQVDSEGTPLEQFWRRRFRDSALDECCGIVLEPEPEQPKRKRRSRKEISE